jgi:hypothetical protein
MVNFDGPGLPVCEKNRVGDCQRERKPNEHPTFPGHNVVTGPSCRASNHLFRRNKGSNGYENIKPPADRQT